MDNLRSILTVLLIILLAGLFIYIQEVNKQHQEKENISVTDTAIYANFQFMTKDAVFCYVDYYSTADTIQVWDAMRKVFISHEADELKDPEACRCIQEELFECYDLDVKVSNLRISDYYTKFIKKEKTSSK